MEVSEPLIQLTGLGVKYTLGHKRDDLQSLTYRTIFKQRKKVERWALQDVDITSYAGDILGIIGPNGAGKSTLCRVLSGVLKPDTGTVNRHGKVSALLALGVGFREELSGRENIFLNGMMVGFSRREMHALCPSIIAFAELESFIDQPLKRYSTGMKARLGFSIAVAVEPDILIVDETLSVGDAGFSERAGARMQELVAQAKTVWVVTHQLKFVEQYCTQAIWLEQGQIKAAGLPGEVVPRYRAVQLARKKDRPKVIMAKITGRSRTTDIIVADQLGVQFSLGTNRIRLGGWACSRSVENRDTLWALSDVSFRVHEGEVLGVIGRNGAGKTTLCKVLTGILHADSGTVRVQGDTTALLTLGAGFDGQISGRDNVYLKGMLLGVSHARLQAMYDEIVEFAGLAKFMHEPLKHFSHGMRARLGFSIAAIIKPDVLILDETLSVGDVAFYEKASQKIQELIADARAVIVVTHRLDFVEKVCTRALWLSRGRIEFEGDPQETVTRYRQSLTSG